MAAVPVRYPNGVSTGVPHSLFSMFPVPQPVQCNYYFNDFNSYVAGDWTVTTVNSGTSALQALSGGSLLLTTGATDTNYQGNTLVPAQFAIVPSLQAWFLINVTMANVLTESFVIGMTSGGPSAPTDGVYFTKAAGSAAVSGVVRASSTSTTQTALFTIAAATATSFGWYYDGRADTPSIHWFSSAGMSATAYGPMPQFGGQMVKRQTTLTNIPVEATVLAPQFYLTTTSGSAAKTLAVDYLLCANEMARF